MSVRNAWAALLGFLGLVSVTIGVTALWGWGWAALTIGSLFIVYSLLLVITEPPKQNVWVGQSNG